MQIHNPGDEFWLYLDGFPTEMPTYYLKLKDDPNLSYIDVRLRDTIMISKSTEAKPCWEGLSGKSYAECLKAKVISDLSKQKVLDCSSWITDSLYNWTLPECKSDREMRRNMNIIQEKFLSNLVLKKDQVCYLPCNQISYSAILTYGNTLFERIFIF